MEDFNAAISAALRNYMVDHEIAQQAIADYLGRSQSYVWGRLSGKNDLSVDIVGAVARLSGKDPRALMMELTTTTLTTDTGQSSTGATPGS